MDISGNADGHVSAYGRSMNGLMEFSGSSMGDGNYYRYTDINVNDVRMMERISANTGILDMNEHILVKSKATIDPESILIKYPCSQIYLIRVNETWPVMINATRNMDYIGIGISDREAFGNNFDYVDASYFRSTNLKKDRICELSLKNKQFIGEVTDDFSEIYLLSPNKFLSSKNTDYRITSLSDGDTYLTFKQVTDDYSVVNEYMENYRGTFKIDRHISLKSAGGNESNENNFINWLKCCSGDQHNLARYPEIDCIFRD